MGNKYHVLHRHLSRLSRPDDLGLGVAVPSIHESPRRGVLGNPYSYARIDIRNRKGTEPHYKVLHEFIHTLCYTAVYIFSR